MAFPAVQFSALLPGSLAPGSLAFPPLAFDVGPPTIHPTIPEAFGGPNHHTELLRDRMFDAMAAVVDGEIEYVETVAFIDTDGSWDTRTFVFHGGDWVTTMRLEDPSGNYEAWLAAIAGDANDGPHRFTYSSNSHGSGGIVDAQLTMTDPASWIRDRAPNGWTARSQSGTKDELLADAQRVAGPAVTVDEAELVRLWGELVAASEVATRAPATEDDFAEFAAATGFALPSEVQALLKLSNGADGAFSWRPLMSVAQMTQEWRNWKQIFDDFTMDDLTGHYASDEDKTLAMYTNPHWVPILDEGTGNFVAIDLLPGPAGRRGQIIYFGADVFIVEVLADDLADLVRRQLDYVRGGGDEGDSWIP